MSVGVIGAGNWGKNLVRTFHKLDRLGAVAEANPGLRESLSKEYPGVKIVENLDGLLETGVAAIIVATPAPTHCEIGCAALMAGKDVFVEKPIALSLAESRKLVDLAEEKDRILMVGHLLLFQPAVQWMRQFIGSGGIGSLCALNQERLKLGRVRSVENVLWSFGVHDIAVILHLVGKKPVSVGATGLRILQDEVEDDVHISLRFEGGAGANLHVSWLWPEQRRRLTAIGSRAMLTYDETSQEVRLHKKSVDASLRAIDDGSEVVFRGSDDPLTIECAHFLECVEKRKTPLANGRNALEVVEVLERASTLLKDGGMLWGISSFMSHPTLMTGLRSATGRRSGISRT